MHHDHSDTTHGEPRDPHLELEVLISRLIDGEATDADRSRFQDLADADPALWRRLALRQSDMETLSVAVDGELQTAVQTPLPVRAARGSALAFSGWAAVLLLGAAWFLTTLLPSQGTSPNLAGEGINSRLTSVEHYEQYVQAPYVLGELAPVIVDVEELSDGRIAIQFIRRIEEVAFFDSVAEIPEDAEDVGELPRSPRLLRSGLAPQDL